VDGGRGATYTVSLPDGTAYLRRYLRGGAVRYLIYNSYFLDNRPLREFELLLQMQDEGLPVPAPLGVVWRSVFGWYQGAIATRALDAENLYHYLRNTEDVPVEVLHRAGAAIRALHDAHIWHADLQLGNILATRTEVWLIDFDNARRISRWHDLHGHRNMLRLRRSFEKAGMLDHFAAVGEGYGGTHVPAWLSRLYRAGGRLSGILRGPGGKDE
jgi:3-deoxy-D-manno-octulosonic acid kinase